MDNQITLLGESTLHRKIFTMHGLQVMLDRDLAELYHIKPIHLRQQAKRNISRFPPDFMFQLNEDETESMVSQNVIPSKMSLGGSLPFVFTEQGVANLSSVLTSERAITVNIQIMRAFVAMRRFLASNAQIFYRLDNIEKKQTEHDMKFDEVFNAIESRNLKPQKGIFFEGQVFDAHKFISDLIRSASKSIILIDNYVDDTVLTLFCKRAEGVSVKILTKDISRQLQLDLRKYNNQYPPLEIVEFPHSHDRFLIIDDMDVYHIGASLKDLGKKWCGFSRFEKEAFELSDKLTKFNIKDKHLTEKIE